MSFMDEIKRIASKMKLRREYLRGNRGKLEPLRQDLKNWEPKNIIGKTGRATGLGAIDLSWFLCRRCTNPSKALHCRRDLYILHTFEK